MSELADLPLALTVEEAAAVLRIGRSAAYGAVRSGDLPTIRVGRAIRIPRHRLEQMLGLQKDDEPVVRGLEVDPSGKEEASWKIATASASPPR